MRSTDCLVGILEPHEFAAALLYPMGKLSDSRVSTQTLGSGKALPPDPEMGS